MSIDLMGGGRCVCLRSFDWNAVQKIARKFGWKDERKSVEQKGRGYELFPENDARALATALYKAIRAIEADRLNDPLLKLVKEVQVDCLRDVADLASVQAFTIVFDRNNIRGIAGRPQTAAKRSMSKSTTRSNNHV